MLAREFDLHRSTMFRELQSLESVGYVRRQKDGTYTLGLHLISLARKAVDGLDLRGAAHEHLRRLHRKVGNTIHLAARMEQTIVYVDKVEDPRGVRMYSRIGNAVVPHCSGVGKAILANIDRRDLDAVLAEVVWEKYTETTITSREELESELRQIRSTGWAADNGEFEDFINCIAVPITNDAGVLGAISVAAIKMVQDLDALKQHIPLVKRTAALIAGELG